MKKVIIAIVLAALVCLAGMYVNYRTYKQENRLKFAIRHHGGEITIEEGFGLQAIHTYGMTPEQSDTHDLRFSAFHLLIWLAVCAVMFYGLLSVAGFFMKRSR